MIDRDLTGGCAWGAGLDPSTWIVSVPDACLAEVGALAERLRGVDPNTVESLAPERFHLPESTALMRRVRDTLIDGPGLAVVDRFPVREYGPEAAKAIGWLLANVLGRIVSQKWDGTRLYDVKDSGKPLGYGVRRSVTNLGQPFHTDGPWLWRPPAFVGLFCLATALAGGESRARSLVTAHNEMRARHPRLMPRLYGPFCWDRQAEHGPDEPRYARHPIFADESGTLAARYYDDYITNGQKLADEPLDAEGADAIAALREIVDTPSEWVQFRIEQGQFQYLNNRQIAHSRTAFEDSDEPNQIRHMLRLWNREEGTLHVDGQRPT